MATTTVTALGGVYNQGILFKITPAGILTVLHSFGDGDGALPVAAPIQATRWESVCHDTQLYTFAAVSGAQAQFPEASLVQGTNGSFYGTTENGGAGLGSIFKLDMGLGPFITFVLPNGKVGRAAQVLGQGLTGTTAVTFNGIPATTFKVVSDTYLKALVPSGATTGLVIVATPSGPLTSNKNFVVK